MENTFGQRLVSARKMAGYSLQKLADLLGNIVTKQALNKYEQGKMLPDSNLLIKLSEVLDVSSDYFFTPISKSIEFSNVDYRKYSSKISKTDQTAIEEKSKNLLEKYLELEFILGLGGSPDYFNYPNVIKDQAGIEHAANKLREKWKLGLDPIPNVVAALEDKGYHIVEVEAPDKFDGLSAEVNGKKVIVLNKNIRNSDVVRRRFTALHELAHHSLKFSENLSHRETEKLCQSFAGAVLYPKEMAIQELLTKRLHFYEQELVLIKEKWGIAISAIFRRALQLGIISDYVYKSLNIDLRSKHLHINEPGQYLSKESPERFERLIYLALAKELISVNEAAYFADKRVFEFRQTMNQLV
jgi:Zn-dependent peptidase ImmA (M78 family)